jgi:hypothetical protein
LVTQQVTLLQFLILTPQIIPHPSDSKSSDLIYDSNNLSYQVSS